MPTAERVARNEDLFRDVNERIRELQDDFAHDDSIRFVCECSDLSCTSAIQATRDEYRGVRRDATHFMVVPGHVEAEHERVVATNHRFEVVEKFGVAGAIAEERAG